MGELNFKGIMGEINLILMVFIFIFGACIGSFSNVCIYRIPRGLSLIRPGSFCPECGHKIYWYFNIPILSYIILAGRCRWCGEKISPRYITVEILTAILFVLVWLKYSVGYGFVSRNIFMLWPVYSLISVVVYWIVITGLIIATFVDIEHMIIPDRISIGGIILGIIISSIFPEVIEETSNVDGFIRSLTGAVAGFALLWFVSIAGTAIFKKEAMGFGDVKLISAIGAFLGWRAVIFVFVLSSFIGAVVGIMMVLSGKKEMQSKIPFGPYLALAAVVWILWGPLVWSLYWNIFDLTKNFV